MKKHIALFFVISMALLLAACNREDAVLSKAKTYQVTTEIHSLDIRINAADFVIVHGDDFSVESNLKYLSVYEKDGVLNIVDEAPKTTSYADAKLKLYLPSDIAFEEVEIVTGAAKLTVDSLSANSVELELGAGNVNFENLNAYSEIDIEGGAGKITIAGGTLNDLTLRMGVGELNLTAALLGKCDLEFGVGESNLTLVGSRDDYTLDIEKGIGSITVDGNNVSDYENSGTGNDRINIEGGVGTINLEFEEPDFI